MAIQIPDPLRPYLSLIRAGLAVTVLAASFIGGCNHGENRKTAEAEAKVAAAEAAKVAEQGKTDACATALNAVNAQSAHRQAEAAALRQAQMEQTAAARDDTAAANRRAEAAAKALSAAKAQPACAAQLEMELCPEIPVL